MAKRLTMAEIDTILTLHKAGHSNREIAALLGVNRETIGKYLGRAKAQNQPNAPTGNSPDDPNGWQSGGDAGNNPGGVPAANQPNVPTGPTSLPISGPASECKPFREQILAKIEQGLEAVRIHQDLVEDHGEQRAELLQRAAVHRPAAAEVAAAVSTDGDRGPPRKPRWTSAAGRRSAPPRASSGVPGSSASCSPTAARRIAKQCGGRSSEAFIACLENAFRHFGGVPKRLVIDNLKAAVARGDWYDPEVHPKLQSFARHYGTVFLPTKPYTPRHKGKIESGVKYVKRNALKARIFTSLVEENEFLLNWETQIADQRIHGTTKQQVEKLFEQAERRELLPLPAERFPFFHEARHTVHRDGHLEVDKAFYSAPPEYVGRRLWVRWDSRLVRIFNDHWEQIAVHAKAEPGRFRTAGEHIPKEKVSAVERGTDALLRQVAAIGPQTRQWAEATTQARGVEGVRVLVGLKNLAGKHDSFRPGRCLPRGPVPRGLSPADHPRAAQAPRPGATAVRVPPRTSDHSSPERLFARFFTPIPKGPSSR